MSRPGHWKVQGVDVPISTLEDSHIRHALRYVRTAMINSRVPGTRINSFINSFWQEKFIELGNDAQRRGMIPAGDITEVQLFDIVGQWQVEWDAGRRWYGARPTRVSNSGRITLGTTPNLSSPPRDHLQAATDYLNSGISAQRPTLNIKSYVSKTYEIESEIGRLTGYIIRGPIDSMDIEIDRRLDMDL